MNDVSIRGETEIFRECFLGLMQTAATENCMCHQVVFDQYSGDDSTWGQHDTSGPHDCNSSGWIAALQLIIQLMLHQQAACLCTIVELIHCSRFVLLVGYLVVYQVNPGYHSGARCHNIDAVCSSVVP